MPEWVRRGIANAAINAGLVAASLLITLLFCEFVLFRFVLLPSDVPENAFVNGLVRYAPHQSGIWRVRNEIAAPFAMNKQGWNSGVADYAVERKPGVMRVAVVGDSMVEALQVPHDRSMAERLATELSHDRRPVEVYRFGISGAPLSQYLHMIEREVLLYRPDWIVVVLVHNDFDETFRFVQGRYTSSFLKLKVADGNVVGEVPPTPWQPGAADWVRRRAIGRYMYYRWQVHIDAIRDLFLPSAQAATGRYDANVDIGAVLSQMSDIAAATDYVFGRMAAVAQKGRTRLLLAMDGVRGALYSDSPSQALKLNQLSAELARKYGLEFLDLHPAFRAEWNVNRRPFEFMSDGHWNEYGHAVAAHAIAHAIEER
jgi:GDSL-like Lipase/Acylhydrolase family